MKPRLFIVIAFVLLATAVVSLEFQLRCTQMKFQATTDLTDTLDIALLRSNNHMRQAGPKISEPRLPDQKLVIQK
jgi:hypothetical protein